MRRITGLPALAAVLFVTAWAAGPARPQAARAKFEFTEASLGPLMDAIGKELDQLAP